MSLLIACGFAFALQLQAYAAENKRPEYKTNAEPAPNLPGELRDRFELQTRSSAGKMVLVDFYSAYCGVCRMMEPHLKVLKRIAGQKVHFERMDAGIPENERYANLFGIRGTPGYVLFDQDGKPVYRMRDRISSVILTRQVLRLSNQLPKVSPPPDIPELSGHGTPSDLMLISFDNESCKACTEGNKFLSAFSLANTGSLTMLNLDADEPSVKKYMKRLKVKKLPTYLVLDKTNQVVFSLEGAIDTSERAKAFWDVLQGLNDNGL